MLACCPFSSLASRAPRCGAGPRQFPPQYWESRPSPSRQEERGISLLVDSIQGYGNGLSPCGLRPPYFVCASITQSYICIPLLSLLSSVCLMLQPPPHSTFNFSVIPQVQTSIIKAIKSREKSLIHVTPSGKQLNMELSSGLKLGCLRDFVFLKLPSHLFFSPISTAGFLHSLIVFAPLQLWPTRGHTGPTDLFPSLPFWLSLQLQRPNLVKIPGFEFMRKGM